MATLGIDFQDGFENDEVLVRIGGEERFHRSGVTTKRVLGLAAHTKFALPDSAASVEIAVPTRGLARQIEVELARDTYLGISITSGDIVVITRHQRFGYG
ncbi:MAG: hypothetical protein M3Q69_20245 [Acidobacteriota bacterium]|nr:hypothetical protein [Acidobacteriota bacterium]